MLTFKRLSSEEIPWAELDKYADRSVFQTRSWLEFVAESQRAEPVIARIDDNGRCQGYFSGLITRKAGLRILGSPFDGWTTTYMGLNLIPGADLLQILEALPQLAFQQLKCRILQISERRLSDHDFSRGSYRVIRYNNLEIDLSRPEEEVFAGMHPAKRQGIRKAEKSGVIVEPAGDAEFANNYYEQLQEVFAKKNLTPTYGLDRVRVLIKHLLPSGNVLLLRARNSAGETLATAIFPAFNDTMYFWGGASWRKFQNYRPNEYLMWYAMRYWKGRGMKIFNMGGWADYKLQYGGRPIKGTVLVMSNPRMLSACHQSARYLWKRMHALKSQLTVASSPR